MRSAAFVFLFVRVCGPLLQLESLNGRLELLLALEDLGHELVECSPCAFEGLGAGFDVNDADLFCYLGSSARIDLPAFLEVDLVADEEEVDLGDVGLLVDLLDPEVDHFEGLAVGDVEDEEDAVDVAVVVGRDGVVAGGACGVPDLHADAAAVLQLHHLLLVLHPDGRRVAQAERLVHVLDQQRALPHVALPDYQQLHPHLLLSAHTNLYYPPHQRSSNLQRTPGSNNTAKHYSLTVTTVAAL